MKTHFKSNEIAHIWAHKSAPSGKSPGAMSFRGDTFYSYSTAIARHIQHKGKPAIILNVRGFGPTTSKHNGKVRAAIHGLDIPHFYFSEGYNARLDCSGKELFEYAVSESVDRLAKAGRARSNKGWYEKQAAEWLESAKAINAFFGLRRKVDEKTIERLRASALEAERKAEVARLASEARARIDQQLAFDHWIHNEPCEYFNPSIFPVAFRIESGELVSTLGARIPLHHARLTLRFVLAHRETGWERNGATHQVGLYQLDSIGPDGVKAGCHHITWSEVERLTAILS